MGRTKSNLDLPGSWQVDILILYNEGASDVEVKALIHEWRGSFSNDLWDRWLKEEPEFSETIKKGRLFSQTWWEREGRINLKEPKFSYTGWYMNMKNRFGWADSTKTEHSGIPTAININVTSTDSAEKLKKFLNGKPN